MLQGSDHLTASWKVADGVHHHIDVREEGKENAFSLGTSLWIGTLCCNLRYLAGGVVLVN